jgi:hypothetical protein
MSDLAAPAAPARQPETGGTYERQPDGSLLRSGGGTAMPDRIAPDLGEPSGAPPAAPEAAEAAPARPTRTRRS